MLSGEDKFLTWLMEVQFCSSSVYSNDGIILKLHRLAASFLQDKEGNSEKREATSDALFDIASRFLSNRLLTLKEPSFFFKPVLPSAEGGWIRVEPGNDHNMEEPVRQVMALFYAPSKPDEIVLSQVSLHVLLIDCVERFSGCNRSSSVWLYYSRNTSDALYSI